MNLRELILADYSRVHADLVADYIMLHPELMSSLLDIVYSFEDPISKRAAWSLRIISQKNIAVVQPFITEIIDNLKKTNDIPILKLVLAVLVEADIPEDRQGELLQYTSEVLTCSDSSVACLIYSMDIFFKLSVNEPDLLYELRLMLEQIIPNGSPGVKNKSRRFIKTINKRIGE